MEKPERRPNSVSIRYIAVLGFQPHPRPYAPQGGVRVSIRYIAVLGFQHVWSVLVVTWREYVSIRYIAVLGFQHHFRTTHKSGGDTFPSAISRYLVSNCGQRLCSWLWSLSFHPLYRGTWFPTSQYGQDIPVLSGEFPSAISRYLVSNEYDNDSKFIEIDAVSIRYIAVLGFQRCVRCNCGCYSCRFHPLYRGTWFPTLPIGLLGGVAPRCFHPLYRGTWFPTLPEKHAL